MQKRTLTAEQKKADHNLWIIALITMAVYCIYGIFGSSIMAFCKDTSISVWPRLFTAAGTEYGIAGLGITAVCMESENTNVEAEYMFEGGDEWKVTG